MLTDHSTAQVYFAKNPHNLQKQHSADPKTQLFSVLFKQIEHGDLSCVTMCGFTSGQYCLLMVSKMWCVWTGRPGSRNGALWDVTLYQQDECKVCPCLLMWALSLLHSQNLTASEGPLKKKKNWDHAHNYLPTWHWINPLSCVMCLFSSAVRFFFFFFSGMGIW